jgi:hypothetical protein
MASYAVAWKESGDPIRMGKLDLAGEAIHLESGTHRDGRILVRHVPYRDLRGGCGGNGVTHLVVVAPLKPGMADRVRELVAEGPPFDLEQTAFVRHAIHLTDKEAVFAFEGEGDSAALELSAEDPAIWRAAAAWQECFAERPRVARTAFVWARADTPRGLFFGPTPGPGDSDGGDVFPPQTAE